MIGPIFRFAMAPLLSLCLMLLHIPASHAGSTSPPWYSYVEYGGAIGDLKCHGTINCTPSRTPTSTDPLISISGTDTGFNDGIVYLLQNNVATGQIKSSILPGTADPVYGGSTMHTISDLLTFSSPELTANQPIWLNWSYTITGWVLDGSRVNAQILLESGTEGTRFDTTQALRQWQQNPKPSPFIGDEVQRDMSQVVVAADGSFATEGTAVWTNNVFNGSTLIDPSDPTVNFLLNINANGIFDLSHTGTLQFDLPQGASFSSASGAFLSAVPVPASAWLLWSALLGLVAVKRRKAWT